MLKIIFLLFTIISSCSQKDFTNDATESFNIAKKPYDKKNYEYAIEKLSMFKSKFPYSQYAIEAELLIANSYFELAKYEEAATEYSQFIKLHPKNPNLPFVMYRIGECFWKLAPTTIDREQEFTTKALEEWTKLTTTFPDTSYTIKAQEMIKVGRKRLAQHIQFIARFYCKQKIYHACLYRYLELIEKYNEFPELIEEAKKRASQIWHFLAKEKEKNPQNDKNIYLHSMSIEQLKDLASKFKNAK